MYQCRGRAHKVDPQTKWVPAGFFVYFLHATKFVLLVIKKSAVDTFEQYKKASNASDTKTFIFHIFLKMFTLFDKCCKHLDILRKYKWLWRMKLICISQTKSKFKLGVAHRFLYQMMAVMLSR